MFLFVEENLCNVQLNRPVFFFFHGTRKRCCGSQEINHEEETLLEMLNIDDNSVNDYRQLRMSLRLNKGMSFFFKYM